MVDLQNSTKSFYRTVHYSLWGKEKKISREEDEEGVRWRGA